MINLFKDGTSYYIRFLGCSMQNTFLKIIIPLLLAQLSEAQQPAMVHYTVDDKLPSSEVYHVIQDKKGYLWFSTNKGICRYDGYTFKTFTTEDGLCDNTVFEIHEDPKGRLFFITYNNQFCFLDSSGFVSIPLKVRTVGQLAFSGDTVWTIKLTLPNYELMGYLPESKSHLSRPLLNTKKGEVLIIKELTGKEYLIANIPGNFLADGGNYLRMDYRSGKIRHFKLDGMFFEPRSLYTMDKTYLVCRKDLLYSIDSNEVVSITRLPKGMSCLYEDPKGNIYVGCYGQGVRVFKKDFVKNKKSFDKPLHHFLSGKTVTSVLTDHENGLWFTTLEDGVYYMPASNVQTYSTGNGIDNDKVLSITGRKRNLHQEEIYIGLQNGLVYMIRGGNINRIHIPPSGFSGNAISKLITLPNGDVWGSYDRGDLYNLTAKKSVSFDESIKDLFLGKNFVWAVYFGKLVGFQVLPSPGSGTRINRKVYRTGSIKAHAVAECNDTVWIGGVNGLTSFSREKFHFHGKENPLLKTRVTGIKFTGNDKMWLTTRGKGLVIKKGAKITSLGTKQGLPNNLCNSIYISPGDTVWVSTNSGLCRIIPNADGKRYVIRNFTTSDGLASNEVNEVYQSGNIMWVATNKGLSFFDINKLSLNTIPPPIYFESFRINQRDTLLKKSYDLTYNQNNLEIKYVGLSYKSKGEVQYRYKMKGLSNSWVYTTETHAQFTTLPPGNYRFEVMAMNNDGYWSVSPTILTIHIAAPWWQTWWFRSFILFTLIGLIFSFSWLRLRQLVSRERLTSELNRSKQQALAAQMEPHFIFNTLNTIQAFILEENKQTANKYLVKLSRLMRLVLSHVQRDHILLKDEIHALQLYLELEKLRFSDKFCFDLYFDQVLVHSNLKIPSMIIQPYVENAILHGIMPLQTTGRLSIDFRLNPTVLLCIITDNGVGRTQAMINRQNKKTLHESAAMTITAKRMELINLLYRSDMKVDIIDLWDADGKAAGTRVELHLPIIN